MQKSLSSGLVWANLEADGSPRRLAQRSRLHGGSAACRRPLRGARPTYSVIDLEMTGLDPAVNEIISFATVTARRRAGAPE